MDEIRKLEQERLVLPRLPTAGDGQALEPIAVGPTGVSAGAVEEMCTAVTTQEIPEMCEFTCYTVNRLLGEDWGRVGQQSQAIFCMRIGTPLLCLSASAFKDHLRRAPLLPHGSPHTSCSYSCFAASAVAPSSFSYASILSPLVLV